MNAQKTAKVNARMHAYKPANMTAQKTVEVNALIVVNIFVQLCEVHL
jgi:hypothetical protein